MININLSSTVGLNPTVGLSAFVSFPYNVDMVDYVKALPQRKYNPTNKEWEIPYTDVPSFVNRFYGLDEIKITGMYRNLHKKVNVELPEGFEFVTKPFQHQMDGVMYGLQKQRFILGDEQGLGKTKQAIDIAMALEDSNKVLIVCGVNTLKYNWLNEVGIHSHEKAHILGSKYSRTGELKDGSTADKMADLDNIDRIDAKFIITNIETMRAGAKKEGRSYTFPIIEKIRTLTDSGKINMIVFDECHKCKDPTSLQGRAMIQTNAKYMIAMSGTPLMNKPIDLYFPLKWLGYESHNYFQFKNRYCTFGGYGGYEILGYKNLDELRDILSKVMLRRLKSEVLDLPEKIQSVEYVDMDAKQKVIYEEARNNVLANITKIRFSSNVLSSIIRMRQATGYTGILSETIKESAKLDRLEELVEELASSNQKCVIFSNWTEITSVVRDRLKAYNPAYITGETKADERMAEVERFQTDDNCMVIIGTTGAMGTGLTLTASQTVIFVDEPWNRALKDQAEDRCHRIGTKGTVNVITLVTKNTIDERIHDLVYKKGLMSDALVDGKIDVDTLNYLLS